MNATGSDGHLDPISVSDILQTILFSIVCLVGLVGNTLVIYVVIRYSKMQTVTNMYIVNLAIADECFLITIPILIITMIKKHWIFGYYACKVYMFSSSVQYSSSIFLCIMSADRYVAVCHPISSPKWRTPFISRIVSLFGWTYSFFLMLPMITYSTVVDREDGEFKSCMIDVKIEPPTNGTNSTSLDNNALYYRYYTTYSFVCGFVVPLILVSIFYFLVVKKLQTVGPKNKSKEKKRSHKKVTNLVLTVVTVYVLCWLPHWSTQIAILTNQDVNGPSRFVVTLHLMTSCLAYSNSAMNPILYAFLSDNFKKSFLKACTCAADKDVNATLHLENSVFPRKNKHHQGSERTRQARGTSICPNNDDEYDMGPLVSRAEQSTSAVTTRTNNTSLGGSREAMMEGKGAKNGNAMILVNTHPTSL